MCAGRMYTFHRLQLQSVAPTRDSVLVPLRSGVNHTAYSYTNQAILQHEIKI